MSEGHPEKVSDQISDALLDNVLAFDPSSKVECETLVTTGQIVLAGEVKSDTYVDLQQVARDVVNKIGYTKAEYQFNGDSCGVISLIHEQSQDINRGVDREEKASQGAGDQGIMVGFATNKTTSFMPPTFDQSRNIQKSLWDLQNIDEMLDLDSKVQVTSGGEKTKVVVSTQHKKDIDIDQLNSAVTEIVSQNVDQNFQLDLNPSGSFIKGGPAGDTGLTGRKIVVDAYGPSIPVGGGAFSGKDPSKVDRSAAYAARHLAKNIVAHELSNECLVRVSYAIGKAEPYELTIETYDTLHVEAKILNDFVNKFDMKPGSIIERLDLTNVNYRTDTLFSHFGHANRNWEKIENI